MREAGDGPDGGDDEETTVSEATATAEADDPDASGDDADSDAPAASETPEYDEVPATSETSESDATPVNDETPATGETPESDDSPRATADESTFAVPTETESERETAWRRTLAAAGELTPNAVDAVVTIHGKRGVRAVEAVSEGRVKRYRDFTVVVGHADEYVVEDGGCTCKDSSYNLDTEDDDQRCWHVLAAAIAERIGEVDHHDMWYSDVREFL